MDMGRLKKSPQKLISKTKEKKKRKNRKEILKDKTSKKKVWKEMQRNGIKSFIKKVGFFRVYETSHKDISIRKEEKVSGIIFQ